MENDKIIYDLVKETRDDVKSLAEKLNAHILKTSIEITDAKAPQTFLKTAQVVALWLGAMGGFLTPVFLFFTASKH